MKKKVILEALLYNSSRFTDDVAVELGFNSVENFVDIALELAEEDFLDSRVPEDGGKDFKFRWEMEKDDNFADAVFEGTFDINLYDEYDPGIRNWGVVKCSKALLNVGNQKFDLTDLFQRYVNKESSLNESLSLVEILNKKLKGKKKVVLEALYNSSRFTDDVAVELGFNSVEDFVEQTLEHVEEDIVESRDIEDGGQDFDFHWDIESDDNVEVIFEGTFDVDIYDDYDPGNGYDTAPSGGVESRGVVRCSEALLYVGNQEFDLTDLFQQYIGKKNSLDESLSLVKILNKK